MSRFAFFLSRVRVSGDCWEWTGCHLRKGYGHLWDGPCKVLAHRWIWRQLHGDIPAGLVVMHHCDNPRCVRPSHLRLGTYKENTADMLAKRRGRYDAHPESAPVGERNPNAKLTAEQVANLRARYALGGVTYGQLAELFGASVTSVSFAVSRRTWRHVA